LKVTEYENIFLSSPFDDVRELEQLRLRDWLDESSPGVMRLTEAGLENSDVVAPLLYSAQVRRCLEEFVRR
jgi:hypothetical protein